MPLRRFEFDGRKFFGDVERASKELGQSVTKTGYECGLTPATITHMRHRGRVPCAANVLSLCDYLGLDPMAYVIDLDALAAAPRVVHRPENAVKRA